MYAYCAYNRRINMLHYGGSMEVVNLSLDEVIADNLKLLAGNEHKPVSQWVTDAVFTAMKEQGIKEEKKDGKNNG